MTFIGFLAEKKEEIHFEKALKIILEKLKIKAMVVAINEKTIGNVKNIRFETIIMNRNIENESLGEFKEMINTAKYLLVNGDAVSLEKIQNIDLMVITYGFGSKCTVTTSSVEEEELLLCLQRSIYNKKKERLEPQEIKVDLPTKIGNQTIKMALATIELLYQ